MRLYFDMEFTGLHQDTTPISIGIVDENNRYFYAEFTDYARDQVNDWITNNVLANLILDPNKANMSTSEGASTKCVGSWSTVRNSLLHWLLHYASKNETVEFWSDVLAYDWMLLNKLISNYEGGYPNLPQFVYYIPFDLATAFKMKGIDPDISRKEYSGVKSAQHNALSDALMIKKCYERLMEAE